MHIILGPKPALLWISMLSLNHTCSSSQQFCTSSAVLRQRLFDTSRSS